MIQKAQHLPCPKVCYSIAIEARMIEEVMPIVSLSRRRSTRTAVDGEAGVQMSRGEPGVPVSCDFLFIQEGEEGE